MVWGWLYGRVVRRGVIVSGFRGLIRVVQGGRLKVILENRTMNTINEQLIVTKEDSVFY